jgi:acetyl esterase/lipase
MPKSTCTYKTVGDLPVQVDIHRPDGEALCPVVISIHGGALIMGNRGGVDQRLAGRLLAAGYAIVSVDYRLAPETQLPGVIQDIEDAYTWVHDRGPDLFHLDTDHIGVMGGSAGGYLTLVAGYRCTPRPAALVSLWGYGDLVGDWYSAPSPHHCHHGVVLSQDEAWSQVSGPPIADDNDRNGDGGAFYRHCRQQGTWPQAVSGWNPHTQAEQFHPYMPVLNVDAAYPPTCLLHGTADTDVPFEQSTMMATALSAAAVEHELHAIDGAEHGLADGAPGQVDAAFEAAFQFLNRHLRG